MFDQQCSSVQWMPLTLQFYTATYTGRKEVVSSISLKLTWHQVQPYIYKPVPQLQQPCCGSIHYRAQGCLTSLAGCVECAYCRKRPPGWEGG